MKKLHLAVCLVTSIALSGCAQIASGINQVSAALSSPQSAQALANARGWAQIFACFVTDASSVATQIEAAVNANQAAKDTTGQVYTVSAIVCTRLGGTPTAKPVAVAN